MKEGICVAQLRICILDRGSCSMITEIDSGYGNEPCKLDFWNKRVLVVGLDAACVARHVKGLWLVRMGVYTSTNCSP